MMDEIDISALAANAAAAYGEERVRTDDRVVGIDFDEATLTFCVRGDKGILERLRTAPDSANADGERLALVKELATKLLGGYGILADAQVELKLFS